MERELLVGKLIDAIHEGDNYTDMAERCLPVVDEHVHDRLLSFIRWHKSGIREDYSSEFIVLLFLSENPSLTSVKKI